MSDMAKYPGLIKRGNIWYYRVKVPVDLVEAFGGQKEKKKSLQTSDRKKAKQVYLSVAKHFSDLFEEMRGGGEPVEPAQLSISSELALLLARRYVEQRDSDLPDQQSAGSQYSAEEIRDALIDRHIQVDLLKDVESDEGAQMVWRVAEGVAKDVGISLSVSRKDHHYFVELMRRAMLELARRGLARANGNFSGKTHDALFSDNVAANGQYKPGSSTLSFGDLCDQYLADFEVSHSVKSKSLTKKKASLQLLKTLIEADTSIKDIGRAQCRSVRDTLAKLPSNMNKKNKSFSIEQHLAAALSQDLPVLSYDTQKTYLNALKAVVTWGAAEGLMQSIDTGDLLPIGDKTPLKEKKLPFTVEQLRLMFKQPLYVGCKNDGSGYAKPGPNVIRRGRFWIPLIGLFSGMRMNEVCQLNVSDIKRTEGGAVYFRVSADAEGATVKTASGVRSVPVHNELLKLGFGAYVEEMHKAKVTRLFPELTVGVTGYASDPFSKWFNDGFLKKAGAKAEKTSFHSFRHAFRDALRDAVVSDEIADALGGWKTSKSTGEVYGSGYSVDVLSEHLNKIEYPNLDLSHLYQL